MKSAVFNKLLRLVLLLGVSVSVTAAWAVGGPPLVTDDPDTPGDGHWEINLAAISQRSLSGNTLAAPDADINYGLGDFLQLKADLPYTYAQQPGQSWKSGPGFANYGVKWRFIDEEQAGYSVSTYPQYAHSLSTASTNRGIAPAGGQFFLPLEVSGKVNDFELDAEIGRNFVQDNPNQWMAGFVVGHECAAEVQCLFEIHETHTESAPGLAGSNQTLLNLGLNWKLNESLTLLAAVGREFGRQDPDQLHSLVYLGLQINR